MARIICSIFFNAIIVTGLCSVILCLFSQTVSALNTNFTKRPVANLTQAEKDRTVTIEFYVPKNGKKMTKEDYAKVRKAIVDAMNKNRRVNSTTTAPTVTTSSDSFVTNATIVTQEIETFTQTSDVIHSTTTATISTTTASVITSDVKAEATTSVAITTTSSDVTSTEDIDTQTTTGTLIRRDKPQKRRRRDTTEDNDDEYTEDDLEFIFIDPPDKDGVTRVSIVGTEKGKDPIPYDVLNNAVKEANRTGELENASLV
jgi:membrane-bound lytic murein transglycosylase